MSFQTLRLNKKAERRVLEGHLWIYSNEINTNLTPLKKFTPGEQVAIVADNDQFLGNGYINPSSLLCTRIVTRNKSQYLDANLIASRLRQALTLRETLFNKPFYRLVFAEGDFLPGLIIDRFADDYVVQMNTAGIEKVKHDVISAMKEVLNPRSILLRNDSGSRDLEQLERYVEAAWGTPPEKLVLEENTTQFETSILTGQKTGWFYDHRDNRARLQRYVRDKSVLDVFSYIGGWGIQAAKFGAKQVSCIDSSSQALSQLQLNAKLNGVDKHVNVIENDAFKALKELSDVGQRFDVVVIDPPAFIKRRKDIAAGLIAYQRLNQLALQVLQPGGFLISASCSMHLSVGDLATILQRSARKQRMELKILERGHQAADHPLHPAIPEMDYIKAFICQAQEGQ